MAQSDQAAGANPNGAQQVKTREDPATVALMRVKEEFAIIKLGGDSYGQKTEIGVKKSEKGGVVDGYVYPEVLKSGYGCSKDVCTLDGSQLYADVLETPTGVSRGLVPGGKMMRQLYFKILARSPINNSPANGLWGFLR